MSPHSVYLVERPQQSDDKEKSLTQSQPHQAGKVQRQHEAYGSFEEFYGKYDYIVRAVITKYVPPQLGTVDDLSQEIWTQFLEGKDGVSYAEIYDPTRGGPTTFMWEFTRRRCLQFLSRSNRTPTARAFSIQPQADEGFVRGLVDPETTLQLSFDEYKNIEWEDLLSRAKRAVHRHPIRGRRDLRWVWTLVHNGYRQDEIAKEMGLSEGTISICMDLLRQVPEVQELRKWAEENGLLCSSPSL